MIADATKVASNVRLDRTTAVFRFLFMRSHSLSRARLGNHNSLLEIAGQKGKATVRSNG